MSTLFGMFPFLQKLFADGGYQGPQFANAVVKILPSLDIEIVKRPDAVVGFKIVPKRWMWNAPLPGSTAAEGLPRIGSASIARRSLSCASLPFAFGEFRPDCIVF